jgi:hypothetical protein
MFSVLRVLRRPVSAEFNLWYLAVVLCGRQVAGEIVQQGAPVHHIHDAHHGSCYMTIVIYHVKAILGRKMRVSHEQVTEGRRTILCGRDRFSALHCPMLPCLFRPTAADVPPHLNIGERSMART